MTKRVLILALLLGMASCHRAARVEPNPETPASPPASPSTESTVSARPPALVASSRPGTPLPSPPAVPPELPPGLIPRVRTRVEVPGDRPLYVYHAPATEQRVIVYLHGVCGNVHAVDSWVEEATSYATLVAMLGDSPCAHRPGRYAWETGVSRLFERLEAALGVVRAERGGLLDLDRPILFGYSQGAARAEALAAQYPNRFPLVILGSPPTPPDAAQLGACRRVALLVGGEEDRRSLIAAREDLDRAQIDSQLFVLPHAHHGQYGPEAPRVVGSLLDWLMSAER